MRFVFLYFILISLLTSCRKDVGQVNYGEFPADIGKIIGTTCAVSGCHNDQSFAAAANYNLSSWANMFKGSSNGSPVVPYNSTFSSLCYYINTYPELGIRNTPTMPINRSPLSYDEVKKIKDWIDAGAPDLHGNIMWADNAKRKKLYAVNQGCDVVTVFDSETQLPMRYIPVGKSGGSPHQVRVSPDGMYWYVIFINSSMMEKYRCSDDSFVGNIQLATDNTGQWNVFNISKDGKRAYVVSYSNSGRVVAVDLENRKLLYTLGGLPNPHGIVLNSDNTKMYVAAQTGNFITEIDTGFTYANQISLENGVAVNQNSSLDPHDMILSPNGNDIFITCQKTNEVRIFNILTNSVSAVIPTGLYPQEIVYSKTMNHYYVTCTYDNTAANSSGSVTKINPLNYSTQNIACGSLPHGITVDDNKKLLYVLSRNIEASGPAPHHTSVCGGRNGFVSFIDLNSFKVKSKKIELSRDPYFIDVRP